MERETYTTSDISIAAYLLVKGHQIVNVEKNEKGQYFFSFKKNEKIEIDSLSFLSSECSQYDNQMRLLRSLLKSK